LEEELLDGTAGLTTGIKTQKYVDGQWQEVTISVPQERPLTINING